MNLVKIFLVLSLVGNAVLAGWLVTERRPAHLGATTVAVNGIEKFEQPPHPKPGAMESRDLVGSRSDGSFWRTGNLAEIAKFLREQGAPREVVAFALIGLTREELSRNWLGVLHPGGLKRWQIGTANMTTEKMAKWQELKVEREERLRSILGPDYDLAILEGDPERRLKWGALSAEKITQLARLADDYFKIEREANYGTNFTAAAKTVELRVDSEFERDVRAVLSPTEAAEYLAFNSPFSKHVQSTLALSGADVDETTYLALYRALADARAEFARNGASAIEAALQPAAYLLSEAKAASGHLDSEAVVKIGKARYQDFRETEPFLRAAGVGADKRLECYLEMLRVIPSLLGQQAPTALQAQGEQSAIRLYESLTSLMREEDRRKFDATTAGRILRAKGNIGR